MLIIKKVETKKEQKDFINFPLDLYRNNEYYVPMLYSSEKNIFKKDYPYNKVCDVCFFNAYLDGKMVGRIQGIIQREANIKWDQKRIRFTRFDAINNQEVADGLFDAVVNFGKEHGMTELVGPLGYSDLEREGLLIEGFEEVQTYEEQYNYDYYQKLIENYGFEKDVDWIEHMLFPPETLNERLLSVSQKMLNKYELRTYQAKSMKELLSKYAEPVFDLIDKTYANLYGTMPLNKEIVDMLVKDFKMILRVKDVFMILDKEDNLVGFALMFPSISDAVRKSRGKITIPFLFRFLKAKKNPKIIDLGLIGVLPQYESKGIATIMIGKLLEFMLQEKINHFETNLNLEDNLHVINIMKHFDKRQNKRRRCFKKDI